MTSSATLYTITRVLYSNGAKKVIWLTFNKNVHRADYVEQMYYTCPECNNLLAIRFNNDNEKWFVGWTGAMWNEKSGRGHFDGIAILEEVRGRGLGKALFSMLAYYNKIHGAKFMTFYTGLNNHARYIYKGAGFKIIMSYASMGKNL